MSPLMSLISDVNVCTVVECENPNRAHCVHGIFIIKEKLRTVLTTFLNGKYIIYYIKVKEEEDEVLIFSDLP